MFEAEPLKTIEFKNLENALKDFVSEKDVDLLLGSMPVSNGVILLLFSYRKNTDYSVFISGGDSRAIVDQAATFLEKVAR